MFFSVRAGFANKLRFVFNSVLNFYFFWFSSLSVCIPDIETLVLSCVLIWEKNLSECYYFGSVGLHTSKNSNQWTKNLLRRPAERISSQIPSFLRVVVVSAWITVLAAVFLVVFWERTWSRQISLLNSKDSASFRIFYAEFYLFLFIFLILRLLFYLLLWLL